MEIISCNYIQSNWYESYMKMLCHLWSAKFPTIALWWWSADFLAFSASFSSLSLSLPLFLSLSLFLHLSSTKSFPHGIRINLCRLHCCYWWFSSFLWSAFYRSSNGSHDRFLSSHELPPNVFIAYLWSVLVNKIWLMPSAHPRAYVASYPCTNIPKHFKTTPTSNMIHRFVQVLWDRRCCVVADTP